ncbi:GGDEF domain-containing protein [Lysinibacillus sp. UGB7]|uniref:GGDEF domain-containing protein n=1 Tax=Lysinibacillus sp. UGB7 TaxID=3411039 RepID=UPI003B7B4450
MPLLAIVMSALYQYIRLKFNLAISLKNARKENMLLLISQILLIISASIYVWLPLQLNFYIPFLVISLFLVELIKPWLMNELLLTKILIATLLVATFIPFIKGMALIILLLYLVYGGYRYSEFNERFGILIIVLSAILTITTNTDSIVWAGTTVYFALNHIQHTSQLLSMLRQASDNVITDALTGLYNRRWLYKKAEQLARQQEIGIIFCDIDNFKKLNDEKGHEHGDLVLQQTGEIMRRVLNGYGFASRYGGEELIGLVTDTMFTERLAEKILEAVRKEINITMSIGIAVGQGSVDELLKTADERMYISKNTGKNKITLQDEVV